MYHHTQRYSTLVSAIIIAGLLAMAVSVIFVPPLVVALIAMAWAAWTFSLLTVTVDAEAVEWFFRGGFWRKRIAIADIGEARPVQNRWWYGWGIHLTPQGWLYNVGGMSAVELTLKSGRRLRIGSNEPVVLAAEIRKRMSQS